MTSYRNRVFHGILLVLLTGCGAGHYRRVLLTDRAESARFQAAESLKNYSGDVDATRALIAALHDCSAAVRYAAAGALESHLARHSDDRETRKEALLALVSLLDDTETEMICLPVFGPLLPGMTGWTLSVRSRAFATLVVATRRDFGLDKPAWRKYVQESFPDEHFVTLQHEVPRRQ